MWFHWLFRQGGSTVPIDVQCSCGKRLKAPDNSAGKRGKCPACGQSLLIAASSPAVPVFAKQTAPAKRPASRPPELSIAPIPDSLLPEMLADRPTGSRQADEDDFRVEALAPLPSQVELMRRALAPKNDGPPKTCPSCKREYPSSAKLCTNCGIDLASGRSIRVSQAIDEEYLYTNADTAAQVLSWIIPFGLFPFASDAYGKFKPYAIWALAVLTILISVTQWIVDFDAPKAPGRISFGPWADLMLWTGSEPNPILGSTAGEFHWYQLLTNTFLHGGIMHLVGNMVFLIVFGSGINALLGPLKTISLYLLLAILASLAFLISCSGDPMLPALGASGAIMGLAGMYFILLPASKVHMILWLRLGLFMGFRRFTKCFAVRGRVVLLCYIALDVLPTAMHWRDSTAHWAHLGGFICGIIAALALLIGRQVDARGDDLLSMLLGQHAWKILGTPADRAARS